MTLKTPFTGVVSPEHPDNWLRLGVDPDVTSESVPVHDVWTAVPSMTRTTNCDEL